MSCKSCSLIPGQVVEMWSSYAGCINCNTPVTHYYPQQVIYVGKENNYHLFLTIRPNICPGCGENCRNITMNCHDGGGILEIPLLLQLPVEEEIWKENSNGE